MRKDSPEFILIKRYLYVHKPTNHDNLKFQFCCCTYKREKEKVSSKYLPQPHESAFLDPLLLQVYPQAQEYEYKH